MTRTITVAALAVSAALSASAALAAGPPTWSSRVAAATHYVEGRAGLVSFALVDERGRLHGYRARALAPSASLLKPMLLVAYLRKAEVRGRSLRTWERDLLGPMIRRSDNAAASVVLGLVGSEGVNRLARVAGMASFHLVLPYWGHSEITASEQARFFRHIDAYVPSRHRAYALRLLASIVDSQRWGVAPVAPLGWRLHFKGGWSTGTGLVDHQVALLRAGGERISLAILTRFNPDHAYGKETLRGVAARLLRGVPRPRLVIGPAARFAFSRGYVAWFDPTCATLRIRALAGGGVAIPTGAAECASVRLALAGSRALWSWPEEGMTRLLTASLDDPAPTEVAALEEGDRLRRLRAGGTTLAFSYDSPDGSGRLVLLGGPTCSVPGRARIALGAHRFAVAAQDGLEVRDSGTCELVAALHPSGTVEGVALAGDLLAALVHADDGRTRIIRYSVGSGTRLSATRISSAAAPWLDATADWVVYRVGRRIAGVGGSPVRTRRLWLPGHREIGLSTSSRRVVWLATHPRSESHGRIWMLALPR
jgi:hypothetical protein